MDDHETENKILGMQNDKNLIFSIIINEDAINYNLQQLIK